MDEWRSRSRSGFRGSRGWGGENPENLENPPWNPYPRPGLQSTGAVPSSGLRRQSSPAGSGRRGAWRTRRRAPLRRGTGWSRTDGLKEEPERADARRPNCFPGAPQESRDFVERALRGGEADALRGARTKGVEAFEREREMRSSLGRDQCVDFVDDDRLDRSHRFTRVGCQHQVQRFGRRDEDVGGLTLETCPFGLGRITGADRDSGCDERFAVDPPPSLRSPPAAHAGSVRRRRPAL